MILGDAVKILFNLITKCVVYTYIPKCTSKNANIKTNAFQEYSNTFKNFFKMSFKLL